jgi:hypothetical protein
VNAVEFLGSFSKERFTEEHYYFYQLDIWRDGEKLFGFYAFYAGLQGDPKGTMNSWRIAGGLKGKSVSLESEHVNFAFSGNLSESGISGQWSDSMTKGTNVTLQKQPAAQIVPALSKAPLGSYEAWLQWAEQYLDGKDAKNKQLSKELAGCAGGDGQACLVAGNHSNLRGNKEGARQLYETGCRLNSPYSCIFIGREDAARKIFESLCTGKATMENNFACQSLGELEEKAGNFTIAKDWYRKGCNDSLPKVCLDFNRLEKLR